MGESSSSKQQMLEPRVSHEPGHSSASDEDQKPVEVLFDPANPYRRKSSLVTAEAGPPSIRRQVGQVANKTKCIVHQFLESQQRARRAETFDGHDGNAHQYEHQGPSSHHPRSDASKERDSDEKHSRCSVLDEGSDVTGDLGQVDEQKWKLDIARTRAEIDMMNGRSEDLHTRQLTKKQLSEMAWGVRELSRRLGSMRLKFRVKNIFLLTKIYDQDLIPKARDLTKWLLGKDQDVRYTVFIEKALLETKKFDSAGLIEELRKDYVDAGEISEEASKDMSRRLRHWDENMCRTRPHTFDFVITLGGDGTVLYASWLFQRIVPPVFSFALGSLGFLTKFDFDGYQKVLTTAFHEGVTVSLRLRFEGTVMRSQHKNKTALLKDTVGSPTSSSEEDEERLQRHRDLVEELIGEEKDDEHTHRPDGTFEILNEIVVDRGPNPTMSYTEIFGDDEHFTSVLADGVCVSTPTGSTAYNLAAGGSLCHPENPVMLVTAICAHTLSFRPIILPDTIVLRIGVPYDARTSSWASFDGRERVELCPGDYVTISASRYPFACVQAPGRRSEDWVNSISGKLGWNTRQKQKAYNDWEKSG